MELIKKHFPEFDKTKLDKLKALFPLYHEWNQKINVISRKDINNLYEHHVIPSLVIYKCIQFADKTVVADVGTGGGFPGVPLAIAFPRVNFVLIDSVAKKLKVIEQIKNELDLKNISTIHNRIENIQEKYDFILGRAVISIDKFMNLCKKNINKNKVHNGIIYLSGGKTDEFLSKPGIIIKPLYDFIQEQYLKHKHIIYIKGNKIPS
jgi:16S rRNA (guanine527-N7)-methyltransferase